MKLIFERLDKDEAVNIIKAQDYYSALWNISQIVRREIRKDEHTKEHILQVIEEELPI